MKLEVSLHPVRRNKTMLVWETSKPGHMAEEVLVAYTAKYRPLNPAQPMTLTYLHLVS